MESQRTSTQQTETSQHGATNKRPSEIVTLNGEQSLIALLSVFPKGSELTFREATPEELKRLGRK
jgi:hypothetical protein